MTRWTYKLLLRLRSLFLKGKVEDELDDEIRFHLENQIAEHIAQGMSPREARYAALRGLGGVEQHKEECRDMRGIRWLEELWQDLRFGFRMLRKNPGFIGVAVITLALGIGANTAFFSLVHAVLLKPLPYSDPDRLVKIYTTSPESDRISVNARHYVAWKNRSRTYENLAFYRGASRTLTGCEAPEVISTTEVSPELLATLGVQPLHGRDFTGDEGTRGSNSVVIVSYGLWQRLFGSDLSLVGRALKLNEKAFTVVGIMPPGFDFPIGAITKAEIWSPLILTEQSKDPDLSVIGRLLPGISVRQGQAELNSLLQQMPKISNYDTGTIGVRAVTLSEDITGRVRPALLLLSVAVAFLLFIASVNVAGLLLCRATERRHEVGIRIALGASRGRLARMFLSESLLLVMAGGTLGLFLASFGTDLLIGISPEDLPRAAQAGINGPVLFFTAAISLLITLFFGLVPIAEARRTDTNATLKKGGAGNTMSRPSRRLRLGLAVGQIALATVLLFGACLFGNSFFRLIWLDPGLDPRDILTARVNSSAALRKSRQAQSDFAGQVLDRVRLLPGVHAAAFADFLPFSRGFLMESFTIEGNSRLGAKGQYMLAASTCVSTDYFRVLGISLLRGRDFAAQDTAAAAPRVVIVNETMARRYFPSEDPIGHRLVINERPPQEIVGIVKDSKRTSLNRAPEPEMFTPYTQARSLSSLTLAVRAQSHPLRLVPDLRKIVAAVDKNAPIERIRTMEDYLAGTVAYPRFRSILFGAYAMLALALVGVGLYALLAHIVSRRMREIGIRMALGAERVDIFRLVIGQGIAIALVGTAAGLIGAYWLSRFAEGMLYAITPTDPATFATAAIFIMAVSFLACYLPARRATRVDPAAVLRCE